MTATPIPRTLSLTVYGFYPYWLAPLTTEPDKTHQRVDFGTVDRIAFYGLEFTDAGSSTVTLPPTRSGAEASGEKCTSTAYTGSPSRNTAAWVCIARCI